MSLIRRRRESLALEDVPQMPAAIRAHNLNPRHAQRAILVAGNGARHAVKVRRPAASGFELVIGLIQRSLASCTGVDALLGVVLVKLAGARGLSALLPEDAKLFCDLYVSTE